VYLRLQSVELHVPPVSTTLAAAALSAAAAADATSDAATGVAADATHCPGNAAAATLLRTRSECDAMRWQPLGIGVRSRR